MPRLASAGPAIGLEGVTEARAEDQRRGPSVREIDVEFRGDRPAADLDLIGDASAKEKAIPARFALHAGGEKETESLIGMEIDGRGGGFVAMSSTTIMRTPGSPRMM